MNKHIIIALILSLSCIFSSCSTSDTPQIKNDGKLAIVSTDIRGAIHAKMIVWERAIVTFVLEKSQKPWVDYKNLINAADILITSVGQENNFLANIFQEYHGTHLQLSATTSGQQIITLSDTLSHINSIRDTVWELDTDNKGYYYDQAGNYENNLKETYRKLQSRVNEYNKQSFLLFGDEDMSVFLKDFWLDKNLIKQYPDNYLEEEKQMKIKELQKVIHERGVKIAFIKTSTKKDIVHLLEKSWLTLYILHDIDEDSSAWGYLRLIEKRINTFITAFNAYD